MITLVRSIEGDIEEERQLYNVGIKMFTSTHLLDAPFNTSMEIGDRIIDEDGNEYIIGATRSIPNLREVEPRRVGFLQKCEEKNLPELKNGS